MAGTAIDNHIVFWQSGTGVLPVDLNTGLFEIARTWNFFLIDILRQRAFPVDVEPPVITPEDPELDPNVWDPTVAFLHYANYIYKAKYLHTKTTTRTRSTEPDIKGEGSVGYGYRVEFDSSNLCYNNDVIVESWGTITVSDTPIEIVMPEPI